MEERLDPEEQKAAWDAYERATQPPVPVVLPASFAAPTPGGNFPGPGYIMQMGGPAAAHALHQEALRLHAEALRRQAPVPMGSTVPAAFPWWMAIQQGESNADYKRRITPQSFNAPLASASAAAAAPVFPAAAAFAAGRSPSAASASVVPSAAAAVKSRLVMNKHVMKDRRVKCPKYGNGTVVQVYLEKTSADDAGKTKCDLFPTCSPTQMKASRGACRECGSAVCVRVWRLFSEPRELPFRFLVHYDSAPGQPPTRPSHTEDLESKTLVEREIVFL